MFFSLSNKLIFPPAGAADDDGLLAIGGDLSPERIMLAYHNGIFPWYNENTILWWSPDPRFVLFPEHLIVSKSMKSLLKRNEFEFKVNAAFGQVIENCKTAKRTGQEGTWITGDMQAAYLALHEQGHAHSAEAWKDGELVGGLYGIKIGKIFCGESMFSKRSNASKYAFIKYVDYLKEEGCELIDCQVHTRHLESLGAEHIPRSEFLAFLEKHT